MLAFLASSVGVFTVTNLDDLLVLVGLFGSRRPSTAQIAAGQYLGVGALVAISVVAALGLTALPNRWIGLFGIVPLALGVRGLIHRHDYERSAVATSTISVAAVTIANGADNVSVYTPVFRQIGSATLGYMAVFAVLVAIWLVAGALLASRKPIVRLLDRWGHWVIPCVFIAIGTTLLIGSF